MNPDTRSFEARLDRALKRLPLKTAPRTLLPRVLAEIERRAALAWYRRPWSAWSPALQYATIVLLTTLVVGICLAGWEVMELPGAVALGHQVESFVSLLNTIGNTTWTLIEAVLILFAGLSPLVIVVIGLVAFAIAASCLSLGTIYYRLVFARR